MRCTRCGEISERSGPLWLLYLCAHAAGTRTPVTWFLRHSKFFLPATDPLSIARAWLRLEPDSALGPKRDGRKGLRSLVLRLKDEMLRDHGEDQHRFHHGEAIADANARTATERHIREAR